MKLNVTVKTLMCPPTVPTETKETEMKAAGITSSPTVPKSVRQPQTGKGKASKPQLRKGKKHKKPLEDQDTSNEGKWPCLMCRESFAQSRPREVWVQCQICKNNNNKAHRKTGK